LAFSAKIRFVIKLRRIRIDLPQIVGKDHKRTWRTH